MRKHAFSPELSLPIACAGGDIGRLQYEPSGPFPAVLSLGTALRKLSLKLLHSRLLLLLLLLLQMRFCHWLTCVGVACGKICTLTLDL